MKPSEKIHKIHALTSEAYRQQSELNDTECYDFTLADAILQYLDEQAEENSLAQPTTDEQLKDIKHRIIELHNLTIQLSK